LKQQHNTCHWNSGKTKDPEHLIGNKLANFWPGFMWMTGKIANGVEEFLMPLSKANDGFQATNYRRPAVS
jgi:hypothetical protein